MSYECHIVLDFEFNPVRGEARQWLHNEIIEIGAIKLNPQYEEIGRFSCLVKPELSEHIEGEITRLTGIRDSDVREAVSFADALCLFSAWVGQQKTRVYAWSDNDLRQLEDECWYKNVELPENLYRWMDLQRVFQRIINYPTRLCLGLKAAAGMLKLSFDDSAAHRALYDSEVTAALLRRITGEEYREDLKKAKRSFLRAPAPATYTMGSSCGAQLLSLMERLKSA